MMSPDKQPFFAATYIPDVTRYGRVGLREMIPTIKKLWLERRSDLLSDASEITRVLNILPTASQSPGEEVLHRAYRSLLTSFDQTYGGFGGAPKFPSPHNFFFLLRYRNRTGSEQALHIVEHDLCSRICDEAEFMIKSDSVFTAIQRTNDGLCLILRRCSTIRRSWPLLISNFTR